MSNNNNETYEINSNLLMWENRNLKICLDGFDISDFLQVRKIIHMYGGIISAPGTPGTIILSIPGRCTEIRYPKFCINWLFDSIKNNELQDIGKYMLGPEELENMSNFEYWHFLEANTERVCEVVNPFHMRANGKNLKVNRNSAKESENINNSLNSYYTAATPTSDNESGKTLLFHRESIAKEIEVLEDVEAKDNDEDMSIDSDREENNVWNSSEDETLTHAPDYSGYKFQDSKSNRQSDNENSTSCSVISVPRKKPRQRRSALLGPKKKNIRRRYSPEEDMTILQYLINHSAIAQATSAQIWVQLADEGVLPDRTAQALRAHFTKTLIDNVDKYIDDINILAEFANLKCNGRMSMTKN